MTKDKDLTPEELSAKIAEIMGWEKVTTDYDGMGGYHWKLPDGSSNPYFNPFTSWQDWGIVYEWMIKQGFESEHFHHSWPKHLVSWCWRTSGQAYSGLDPDIRTAMLKAAWKAEGKGK